MKRSIFKNLALIVVATTVMITSCNKDEINLQTTTEPSGLNRVDKSIPHILNPYPTTDYLMNSSDADDEKINKQLFEIGMLARQLFVDNSYNEMIIAEAKKRQNSCTDLRQFISSAKSKGNSSVLSSIEQLMGQVDMTHRSTNPERNGETEQYIPAIFVVNAEIADLSKLPFISSGIYVNTELPGMQQYEDYIVVWYSDGSGGFNEILMSEETAMSTTHPIFIIDNAEEEMTTRQKTEVKYEAPLENTKNQLTAQYSSNEYQINNRYETTGNSDFSITGAQITESGSILLICRRDNGTYNTWKKVAGVSSSNIGVLLNHWEQFCDNNVIPFDSNFIFWNTFERDWAKSRKPLGSATRNGNTIYLDGKRKYSGDWYAYDPSQLANNPVDLNTIYGSWAKWHDNSKSRFRIWRVQP